MAAAASETAVDTVEPCDKQLGRTAPSADKAIITAGSTVPCDTQLERTVALLEEAIIARDEATILSLAADPPRFMEDGRLAAFETAFLFNGDDLRSYAEDARSVREILMLGDYETQIYMEPNDRATFIFMPDQYKGKAHGALFWAYRWMRDFFVCEFHKDGDRWVFVYNICFAGSGGPFHLPYG